MSKLWTVKRIAETFFYKEATIRTYKQQGKIIPFKQGKMLFTDEEVQRFIQSLKKKSKQERNEELNEKAKKMVENVLNTQKGKNE